jgi:3-oxoadipate CoA-transferase alpha subunit
MIDKIVDSVAAALEGVQDGSTVMVGGFGAVGQPDALIEGLIEPIMPVRVASGWRS